MLDPEPLPLSLLNKLLAAGVTSFTLNFSGGSDEGYLSVQLYGEDNKNAGCDNLWQEVESWAEDVFCYDGAGDGTDYGDDLTYNLESRTVERSEWFMVREDSNGEDKTFDILPEDNDTHT